MLNMKLKRFFFVLFVYLLFYLFIILAYAPPFFFFFVVFVIFACIRAVASFSEVAGHWTERLFPEYWRHERRGSTKGDEGEVLEDSHGKKNPNNEVVRSIFKAFAKHLFSKISF